MKYKTAKMSMPVTDILARMIRIIAFKDMGRVFEQIQGNDDLWSGSWYILKNAETKERKFENKQDFFKLN